MSGGTCAAPSAVRKRSARARSSLCGRTALCGALAVACAGFAPSIAQAGPQGTVVVGGAVDVRQSGAHTEFTQHSNTALLNHRSFDIGTGESVHFAQPSAGALAVNRVVGSDLPTSIAGKLTANGNVWVLNPSGVAIKGTAQVNVGGLLATTASIGDEAILSGERSFAGAPAGSAVSNAGAITAGQGGVVLVAPVVSNSGTIATQGSDIALGAGSGFTVDFDGDGLTRFEVLSGTGVGLSNAGAISAQGGAAYISAASAEAVQTAVVSIGGRVEATRAEARGGVIYVSGGDAGVTEVSGTLDASQASGDGGGIAVTGDRVDIRSGAVIDASGAAGGGMVEIGGGFEGAPIASPVLASAGAPASAPLPTARRTVVRPDARIQANAGGAGDGGTVIVWADEATAFRGAIEARGGALAGDGGFAEVSGKQGLSFDGSVDLSAAAGAAGTLLLDPASVTIVAGTAGSAAEDAELDDLTIAPGDVPAGFTISAGAVAASVAAANTVIHAADTITQQAAVTLAGNRALTYRTDSGAITLDGALTGTGNALTIDAGGSVAFGNLTVASLDVTSGASIGQGSAATVTVSGGATLDAGGGVTLGEMTAGTLDVSAGGAITQVSGAALRVAGDARFDAGGTVALGASSGRNLEVSANDLSIVGTLAFTNTVALTNAGGGPTIIGVAAADTDPSTFEVTDAEIARIQAQRLAVATGSGGIDVQGVTLDTESLVLDAGSGAGAGHVVFSTAPTTVAGDLSVTGASISQAAGAPLLVRGRTVLSASGDVILANAGNDFDSDAALDAADEVDASGSAVTLVDRDAIALGAIDAATLEVRAGGSITDTPGKKIEVAGATELSALAGTDAFDIRLDNDAAGDRHALGGTIRAEGEDIAIANGATATRLGAIITHDDASDPSATTDATINNGSDGDLTIISRGGAIVDVPGEALVIAGTTDLQAANGANFHDIALDQAGTHDFSESDPLNADGEDIAITDRDGIRLGRITARGAADPTLNAGRNDGALTVIAGGAITDTAGSAITVAGATALTAENATRFFDIALDEPARHDFGGVVSARGEDIILNAGSAIVLGSIDANAGASATPGPDNPIAFYDDNGDGVLSATESAAAGDLTVRAGGTITGTGAAIDVEGRTRLEAVAGGKRFDITLDGPHDFDSNASGDAVHEVDAIGRHITLVDVDAIALGDVSASGDLSIQAGGSVTDTPGEAVTVGGDTTIVAVDPHTADLSDDDFFDIALDNVGLHDFASIDLTGEGIVLVDRQGLSIVRVDSRHDGTPDPTLPGDGIFLEVGQGDFAFETGPGSVPLTAFRSITLSAPNGSFETSAAIAGKDLPDGLTFRSQTGNITLDLNNGFVVQDVRNTVPFTLDAPAGVSRIRIGEGTTPEFLGIGTADFLEQARSPDFNPLFNQAAIGDADLLRVTGDFAIVARSPLTVRFQNTFGNANEGAGTTVLGTTFVGGTFAGFSAFGSFNQGEGTTAALRGFRDAAEIGERALVFDQNNTVNGCAILVPSSCQPIGSLLPALGQQDGLLLGIRFVAPTQDLDDPFTNRGDEEEWQ